MPNQDVLLSVQNLETTFFTKLGPLKAVQGVSYEIPKAKTLGIVGESGCGKSVTSFSIMGLVANPGKVTGGQVLFKGEDLLRVTQGRMEDLRGGKLAMIFQEPMTALNPVLSIGYQIDEQIMRHLKLNKKEARDKSIEMLGLVGIPSPEVRYLQYPHQLSGGMRQRAMIAMALSCGPELLIADEPTTALDVTIQAQILELMQEIQSRFNMTIQFITHDLGVISEISDNVMVMYSGVTIEKAATDVIFSRPRHPYTARLIESIPKLGSKLKRLPTIEGSVPALFELGPGCPFVNRCHRAKSDCFSQRPKLEAIELSHEVACFNPEP